MEDCSLDVDWGLPRSPSVKRGKVVMRVRREMVGLRVWRDGERIAEEHLGSRWRTVEAIAS